MFFLKLSLSSFLVMSSIILGLIFIAFTIISEEIYFLGLGFEPINDLILECVYETRIKVVELC